MAQNEIFPKGYCSVFFDEMKGHKIADIYSQPIVHPVLIEPKNKELFAEVEALDASYSLRADIIKNMTQKENNTRVEQIKQLLRERGINIDTSAAFVHVLKTRCWVMRNGKHIQFLLDDKPLTSWWETVETKFDQDEFGNPRVRAIYGAPPGRAFEDEYLNKPE